MAQQNATEKLQILRDLLLFRLSAGPADFDVFRWDMADADPYDYYHDTDAWAVLSQLKKEGKVETKGGKLVLRKPEKCPTAS